jgi:alpha-mannosidase
MPAYVFTMDQVALLEWTEESDPDLFREVIAAHDRGQFEFVGGRWVEPDYNLPSGESFVRQGLYGQRYLKAHFGQITTVGCNVDPFGHNVMLPQVLHLQGMDSYYFLRPGPHELTLPAS